MSLNRAGFLKQLAASALDVLPVLAPLLAPGLRAFEPAAPELPEPAWRVIGRLGDFAPGTVSPVLEHEFVLIAHGRGLYALSREAHARGDAAPRQALRLEANGNLSLHPGLVWPAGSCLSILTGNRILEEELL